MKFSLSSKILLPSLFILFLGLFTVSFIAHNTTKKILTEDLITSTKFSLEVLISQSLDRNNQVEVISRAMADNYIQIAQLLAIYLGDNAENISTEEYAKIAENIGVDEIHVTDENGVLMWGSVPGFFGFDFNTTDQTKPFIKILNDNKYTLAQEPQLRGTDNLLFQYIGVSRVDKPGIVQIGMSAHVVQEVLKRVDLQNLIDTFQVDEYGGSTFIIDNSGVTLKHKNRDFIGVNVSEDYDWGKKLLEGDRGNFYYNFNNENKFMSYAKAGNNIYCASVYVDPYMTPVKNMDRILIITSVLVGLILSIVIISLLTKMASSPLKSLNKKILILSEGEGDLTQKISIKSDDEVGELASGINEFVSSLRQIVGNIKLRSAETQKIKNILNDEAKESAETSLKISVNVENITNEIFKLDNEVTNSLTIEKKIENSLEELDREVENQVSAVEESTASVNEMVASLKNVSGITTNKYESTLRLVETTRVGGEKVTLMNSLVNDIHDSVSEISNMVTIINDIASQTSLLSMNAAIEAAHAGDEGKGFAVVADEIRKLSESTGSNASSITKVLENIRAQVNQATSASSETNSAFLEINSEVKSVSEALSEINLATEELSNGGEQIIEAMYILQDVSTKVRDGAVDMKQGAIDMSLAIKLIKDISQSVLDKVTAISGDSSSIANGSETIKKLALDLSNNTTDLESEIQRFKTE